MKRVIGLPKEIKLREKRVALTPEDARWLIRESSLDVYVQSGAGMASGYGDDNYRNCGAIIVPDAASLYLAASLIVKVKEPQPSEYEFLKPDHVLFCFLHLASPAQQSLKEVLIRSGVTAIGFETVSRNGLLPILAPMSRIAGGLGAVYSSFLRRYRGNFSAALREQRIFLSYFERYGSIYPKLEVDEPCGKVVIFGGGIAGREAGSVYDRLGADVLVCDANEAVIRQLWSEGVKAKRVSEVTLEELSNADILIGAAHAKGLRAAKLFDESFLVKCSAVRKKIMMDISIDQGGNFPWSRPTTYEEPVYCDEASNLRFNVPNIPSLAGSNASSSLSVVIRDYVKALALNEDNAYVLYPELAGAVNVREGHVVLDGLTGR